MQNSSNFLKSNKKNALFFIIVSATTNPPYQTEQRDELLYFRNKTESGVLSVDIWQYQGDILVIILKRENG